LEKLNEALTNLAARIYNLPKDENWLINLVTFQTKSFWNCTLPG
jgi:hypothetical protein